MQGPLRSQIPVIWAIWFRLIAGGVKSSTASGLGMACRVLLLSVGEISCPITQATVLVQDCDAGPRTIETEDGAISGVFFYLRIHSMPEQEQFCHGRSVWPSVTRSASTASGNLRSPPPPSIPCLFVSHSYLLITSLWLFLHYLWRGETVTAFKQTFAECQARCGGAWGFMGKFD